jgi:hypothetical protein
MFRTHKYLKMWGYSPRQFLKNNLNTYKTSAKLAEVVRHALYGIISEGALFGKG